jgi:hypothetical protein
MPVNLCCSQPKRVFLSRVVASCIRHDISSRFFHRNVRGGGKKRGKPTARPVKLIPAYCFICDLSAFKADPMLKKDMPRQLGMDPHSTGLPLDVV